ncbi:MAG: Mrp/NBP35 family ATP-binding protein [Blautia sp.]|nr:Mrp/NBP35 family ATP-binding protein [Blautia sp.]
MAKECSNTSCDKSSCEGCAQRSKPESFQVPANENSKISHVIGVISGKGGVGKSFVTGSLANLMKAKGCRVGILDADITGPSIGRMYGITGRAQGNEKEFYPLETANGIKVMSVNFLLETEETPVVWRGPILGNVVKQFWSDTVWGDLDYLFVDMPPGTGDVPLTVFQALPLDGVIVVTSPQDLVRMIVTKAVNMAGMMNIPVLGIVENYSYIKCPDCGKEISVFGESHIDEVCTELRVPLIGRMPIDPDLAVKADSGSFSEIHNSYLEAADSVLPR